VRHQRRLRRGFFHFHPVGAGDENRGQEAVKNFPELGSNSSPNPVPKIHSPSVTSNLASDFNSLHHCPSTGKQGQRTQCGNARENSDAFIGKFPRRPELSPSFLIFCGQILSIQYFSQIKMDQPPRKSLIPDILHVRSGNFFNLDTSILGRSTEPASLQSHEIYFDQQSTESASTRHPAAEAGLRAAALTASLKRCPDTNREHHSGVKRLKRESAQREVTATCGSTAPTPSLR
jgi:hypothetical protein